MHLEIDSIPQGAEVIYRGKTLGVTPFSRDVRPWVYLITLQLEGYEQTFRQPDLRQAEAVSMMVDMETGTWEEVNES